MVEILKSLVPVHQNLDRSPVLPQLEECNRRIFNKFLAGVMLLGGLSTVYADEEVKNISTSSENSPKGSLLIGGGGELSQETNDRFVELAGGDKGRIVVVPTASVYADDPDQTVDMYWDGKDKVASAILLHTRSRIKANCPDFVRPLKTATGVWISGGQQSLLADAYVGTLVEEELDNVLKRDGVVGGTSAGAAVLSPVMIRGGNPIPILGRGFQFLKQLVDRNCIIDMHFDTRNRIHRLLHALGLHPESVGLGIGWGAALLVNGSDITVLGKNVWLCHPKGKSKEYVPGEKVDLNALDVPTAIASAGTP